MKRALLLVLLAIPTPTLAGPTRVFRVTTYKEFDEGEARGTQIDSVGEVRTGVDSARVDLGELLAYSSARVDGTLYIGTGDQADVWAQRGKDRPRKIAKLDGVLVAALARAKGGRLFASTLPSGKIFVIDELGEKVPRVRELAKLDAEHVWALSWDEEKHTLYAATGPAGKLFALDVDLDRGTAKPRLLWSSGEKQLLSMVRAEDGSLLVGSADSAILYRVTPHGNGADVRVVHDFDGDEVRAIWRDRASTYVAVNDFKGAGLPMLSALSSKSARTPAQAASGQSASSSLGVSLSLSLPASRDRKGKGAVYRVDDDGRLEELHSLSDGYFTALAKDADGTLWAASGSNGRVYQLRADHTVATVLDLPERQVLFLDLGGAPVLGTGDAAALYHLGGTPKEALYLSKVLDAQFTARWGRVCALGTGVELSTRSGNTQKPDATWTSWQPLEKPETRTDEASGRVQSPTGRFLQVRCKLSPKGVLRELDAYYLPQNQRPRVTEITTGDDGKSTRKKLVTLEPQISVRAHSSIVPLRWKTENPDEDELVYRVYFREENDPNWRLLGGPSPLTKAEYDWSTEGLPDGRYLVRVVASDERANPREVALDSALTSSPILVDNRKPEILGLEVVYPKGQGAQATGRVKDLSSRVTELAWALDGGEWQVLGSKDGLLDDLEEAFSLKLPTGLASGNHTIAIRAADSTDNVGAAQLVFKTR
ncbi:MAG: hypothetical protein ABI321_02430 [Polyangia bacterium]